MRIRNQGHEISLDIRGQTARYDPPIPDEDILLACLVALEDSRVDAVLEAFGIKLVDDYGNQIYTDPE